jgi:malic enzyme
MARVVTTGKSYYSQIINAIVFPSILGGAIGP